MDVVQQQEVESLWLESESALGRRPSRLRVILAAQDCGCILAALMLAYWLRYHVDVGPVVGSILPFSQYEKLALPLLVFTMLTLFLKGAYRKRLSMELVHELILVGSAATSSVATVIILSFMLKDSDYSRGVLIYLWSLMIVLLGLARTLYRAIQIMRYRRGIGVRNLLIVGASDVGKMIMQSVTNRPDTGYRVVGFVDRRSHDRAPHFGRFRRVGNIADLPSILETDKIDDVVLALPGSAHLEAASIIQLCTRAGVGLKLVPDMFRVSLSQVSVDDVAGIPLLDVREAPPRRLERAMKRSIDLVLGAFLALITLPIIGVLAVLISFDSPGGPFIRQERVGKNGRRFVCFKLRTMRHDADRLVAALSELNEADGPIFKIRKDPRLTRVGIHLRRLSLDELPQIWNVIKGDMSLVGPRPPLPREIVKYEPWQMRRLETTPGMTGLWQVSGRSNLNFDEMVTMDIMYVDNWSLTLDLKILARTFLAVLTARGAY